MSYCTCDVCSGTASEHDDTVEVKVRVTFQEVIDIEVPKCVDMHDAIHVAVLEQFMDVLEWEEV